MHIYKYTYLISALNKEFRPCQRILDDDNDSDDDDDDNDDYDDDDYDGDDGDDDDYDDVDDNNNDDDDNDDVYLIEITTCGLQNLSPY
jgi:hypothetical protein